MQEQHWYKNDSDTMHNGVFAIVSAIDNAQSHRKNNFKKFLNLYTNNSLMSGSGNYAYMSMAQGMEASNPSMGKITFNICQNIPDSIQSKITKNKPKPEFLTSKGSFKMQKKAKLLNKFILGQFYDSKIYEIGPKIFMDAMQVGTGFLKVYKEEGKIKIQRVLPTEIKIDDLDAIYGKPRSMHHEQWIDKDVLMGLFPEFSDKIKYTSTSQPKDFSNGKNVFDNKVKVIESWHLKSSEKSEDGLHTMCIESCTLINEKYQSDGFPFVTINWEDMPVGFWGQGLIEQLVGYQIEINKTCWKISKAFDNFANPKTFIDRAAKVNPDFLGNDWDGPIIEYGPGGNPPTFLTPSPIDSSAFQYLELIYQKAYNQSGASESYSTSTKPAGLNSGKALREYNDIQSERFILAGLKYETFFLEAGKLFIQFAKDISVECKNCHYSKEECGCGDGEYKAYKYSVMAKGDGCIEMIDWKDIDLEKDQYMMQMQATSMLSQTPAGRLDDITELMQSGLIDQKQGYDLLDFPDLEKASSLNLSSYRIIENNIEEMLSGGDFIAPEKYDDLQVIIDLGMKYYNKARLDGVEEDVLEILSRYIDEAANMLNPPAPPQPQPMMDPNANGAVPQNGPMGQPAPAPVSPMIPNGQPAMGIGQ